MSLIFTAGAGLVALGVLALLVRRDLRGSLLGVLLVQQAACIGLVAGGIRLADPAGVVAALLVVALGIAQVIVLTALARTTVPPRE